jgi:N-methylhydantoinase A
VWGIRVPFDLRILGGSIETAADESREERRPVMFGGEWIDTKVLRRKTLEAGTRFNGPAIIEQLDTTVAIDPACSVEVDQFGNLVITV